MKKSLIITLAIIAAIAIGAGFLFFYKPPKTTPIEQAQTENNAPKTYSEVFDPPIDPIIDSEKHKATYEKNIKQAKFPESNLIKYPQDMPADYKLYEVHGTESNDLTFIYKNASDQTIQIFEGVGEIGDTIGIGLVETKSGQGWIWQTNDRFGLTLSLSQTSGAQIYIIGSTGVTKEDLIIIADSLFKVYP